MVTFFIHFILYEASRDFNGYFLYILNLYEANRDFNGYFLYILHFVRSKQRF